MIKNKKGFTLVEILITVVIIGLLASMGSLAIMKSINNARIKTAESELAVFSTAVLQLAWDTGRWPNGTDRTQAGSDEVWDISSLESGLMMADTNNVYLDWKGPYYEGVTNDPWGNPYFFDPDFKVDGQMRVVVGSFGPNGIGRNAYDSDDIYILLDD